MSTNISQTLAECAQELKQRTALVEAVTGRSVSFYELNARADAFAHRLSAQGLEPGKRVILMVKPSIDFICLTFALFKIGAPVILIDPGMGYKNLLRCVQGVRPEFFIGIVKAHIFRLLFPKVFKSVRKSFCVGSSFALFGEDICSTVDKGSGPFPAHIPGPDDLAAIIFTTGSTGPPKGVRYEHTIFYAQLRHIRDYYNIGPTEIDQPAFPLFALFSTSLGAKAVIPDMDPTRPARVSPQKYVESIEKYGVSYSFGSPAIWRVIAKYCVEKDHRLQTLKKVLMAGAPVSGELLQKMYTVLPEDAEIFTPYGATESLPIVSIEGREITESTWKMSREGKGVCVGRSLPGIEIQIIDINDGIVDSVSVEDFLPQYAIGEIIVKGDVVTKGYENNPTENKMAKIPDGASFWHRMGDTGYLDKENRLWFCGRRAHRVVCSLHEKTYYSIPCESVFNKHSEVYRSALVGVYSPTHKATIPAIVIEPVKQGQLSKTRLLQEVRNLGAQSELTHKIEHYLLHSDFPVDIRHNAKIFREKLSLWAEKKLGGKC